MLHACAGVGRCFVSSLFNVDKQHEKKMRRSSSLVMIIKSPKIKGLQIIIRKTNRDILKC